MITARHRAVRRSRAATAKGRGPGAGLEGAPFPGAAGGSLGSGGGNYTPAAGRNCVSRVSLYFVCNFVQLFEFGRCGDRRLDAHSGIQAFLKLDSFILLQCHTSMSTEMHHPKGMKGGSYKESGTLSQRGASHSDHKYGFAP